MALIITDRFRKAYRRLPAQIQKKAKKALLLLEENPRHPSLRVKKIRGAGDIFEGRVDQKYRFSFQFATDDKVLRNIDNHDECLKNP